MTKRKNEDSVENLKIIGNIIYKHREGLSLKKSSRRFFLDNRVEVGLWEREYISEKSLTNIENGYNLPNLVTLNYLATALEVDLLQLVTEIQPYIPSL